MSWYVTDTRIGLWIENAEHEPNNAVAGPYPTHTDALDKLRRLERMDAKRSQVGGILMIAWAALMLIGGGWWLIGWVVG
jgi:hypothetical protein